MSDAFAGEIDGAIENAMQGLAAVPSEQRTEGVEQLEGALAYARVSLHATAASLITQSTRDALWQAAQVIADDLPDHVTGDPASYLQTLLNATLLFPAARGRDMEQAAKDAAANYQRSMSQRLKALQDQADTTGSALAQVDEKIAVAAGDISTAFEERVSALRSNVDALEARIGEQQGALDAQLTRHTEAFNEQIERFSSKLQEAVDAEQAKVDAAVKQVEKIAKDTGVLAGAIALKETATYYKDEADSQEKTADGLRTLTVVVALGAVVMGVWAVLHHSDDTNLVASKLAVTVVLGGLAAYTASQSGKHRRREARARDLQLQLTAFGPFTAPLDPDLQQLERVRMTRRTFGATETPQAEKDDTGPGALSLVNRVLRREAEPE